LHHQPIYVASDRNDPTIFIQVAQPPRG
jgi:hypothetical protein